MSESKLIGPAESNMKSVSKTQSRTNRELTETGHKLQLALDAAQMGTFEWELDSPTIEWNPYHYRLFGYEPGEFPVDYHFWRKHVLPEDLEHTEKIFLEAKESMLPWTTEYRIRRNDGALRWITLRGQFVPDRKGKAIRCCGVIFDITEKKEQERALRESEERMRFLAESIPHMVWAAQPDGTSDYYSQRFLDYLGKTAEEMKGWNWLCTLHPDDRERARLAWEKAFTNKTNYHAEFRILQGNSGLYRWFVGSAVPRKDTDGNVTRWFGTCTDIHDRKMMDEALEASEVIAHSRLAELQTVYAASPVGLGFVDRALRFVRVNDTLARFNGLTAEAHLGKTVEEVVGPEIWKFVKPLYKRAFAGETIFNVGVEGAVITEPDSPHHWLASYCPVLADGEVQGVAIAVQDVTVAKRAEAEARRHHEDMREAKTKAENEQRLLEAVMKALPAAVAITDAKGGVLRVNEHFRKVWGGEPPPADSVSDYTAYKAWFADTGKPLLPSDWASAIASTTGRETLGQLLEIERFDGTRAHIMNGASPVTDHENKVVGSAVAILDITELRKAQEELRLSEARLRTAKEAAHLGIFESNLETKTTQWDERMCEIWGFEPGTKVTRELGLSCVHPEDRAAIAHALETAYGGKNFFAEYRIINAKDKKMRWVANHGIPIFKDGKPVRLIGTVQDVTERKAFEVELERLVAERTASLREAIAQMEEFSYTVSHDLRAPLRAMTVYSDALRQDFGNILPEEARECLDRISVNAHSLDRLVQDVLTFSRVARTEMQMERVDTDRLVRTIVEQYPGMQTPEANITVEKLPDVVGHQPSLTQAFSNLLTNAVKFVPLGVKPSVRVWAHRDGENVRFWVSDNGIGIEPKYQSRLFNMFERIHPDLNYEGTGVGLAIVRKAVERMGGKVGIESDGATGSRFWIELPAAVAK